MVERDYFFALADGLSARAGDGETLLLGFRGETSDFIRFNENRVRQSGNVRQARIVLTLVSGRRQASASADLCGEEARDGTRLESLLETLRAQTALLPDDPFLNLPEEVNDTQRTESAQLPPAKEAGDRILGAFDGLDMTGIWACGEIFEGFASSTGQRNWHSVGTFNFDWSAHDGAQSVKGALAGPVFDPAALDAQADHARRTLPVLAKPPKVLKPGRYRAYLAPEALAEVLGLVSWGGFGLKSHRTGRSPLARLERGEARLDHRVTLVEDNATGFAPAFTGEGFIKPGRIPLIENGAFARCLADARSAGEFGAEVNASAEAPAALSMAGGTLSDEQVPAALDTGLYITNVWYCNFSDRNDCRITGMTRFACQWVENGTPRGPVEPMRFDDSLYGILGERLVDLTAGRRLILDADTYKQRSFSSMRLPGALIEDLSLAL